MPAFVISMLRKWMFWKMGRWLHGAKLIGQSSMLRRPIVVLFFEENFIDKRFIGSIDVYKILFALLRHTRYVYMHRIFILPCTYNPQKDSLHDLIEPKQLSKERVCGSNSFVTVNLTAAARRGDRDRLSACSPTAKTTVGL
jgi:hypothetical protein